MEVPLELGHVEAWCHASHQASTAIAITSATETMMTRQPARLGMDRVPRAFVEAVDADRGDLLGGVVVVVHGAFVGERDFLAAPGAGSFFPAAVAGVGAFGGHWRSARVRHSSSDWRSRAVRFQARGAALRQRASWSSAWSR